MMAAAGCAAEPPLEFADWVFPIADGTRVIEYPATPSRDERTEVAFELVEDLVIGGDPSDPETTFYRPTAVVAADNGNIFVVENGGKRVQMFAADGTFLKTLGQEGQGPGEFQMPMNASITEDRLVVLDAMSRRFSVWTDSGDHVADHATGLSSAPMDLAGLSERRMAVLTTEIDMAALGGSLAQGGQMPNMTLALSSYSTEGEPLNRLLEAASAPMPNPMAVLNDVSARIQSMIDTSATPRPSFAVGADEVIYVTPGTEYQVITFGADGETRWALRVAWPRRPFPEASREFRVRALAPDNPEISADDFDWPDYDRAISSTLRTDGAGRLYVYPLSELPETNEEDEGNEDDADEQAPRGRAVDVYSPDGELLVSGLGSGTWSYARGDFVYRIRRDPDNDESVVVRSRLVLRQN